MRPYKFVSVVAQPPLQYRSGTGPWTYWTTKEIKR